jgi:hypothetical protein
LSSGDDLETKFMSFVCKIESDIKEKLKPEIAKDKEELVRISLELKPKTQMRVFKVKKRKPRSQSKRMKEHEVKLNKNQSVPTLPPIAPFDSKIISKPKPPLKNISEIEKYMIRKTYPKLPSNTMPNSKRPNLLSDATFSQMYLQMKAM